MAYITPGDNTMTAVADNLGVVAGILLELVAQVAELNEFLRDARGPVSTNSVESVWAVLKRGIHGVYHHVSPKHLGRYVDEFTFRLNEGNVKRHSLERLDSFIDAVVGKRITYAEVIA